MKVPVDKVHAALARLWSERSAAGTGNFACTINVVAVCTVPDDLPRATGVVSALLPIHRGRAIIAVTYPVAEASLEADVHLATDTRRAGEACGEVITLDVRGDAREWIPTTVERLLAPGVPTCLWWVGDLPDNDTLYDRLTETSDMVAIHSADMDLRDIVTLARLVEWAKGGYAMADLNWVRLRTWQECVARFFDDPIHLPRIPLVRDVEVTHVPHGVEADEAASTQAALFAGWFLSRLGVRAARATWGGESGERMVTVPRPEGHAVTVRFPARDRGGVAPGAISSVVIRCSDGTKFVVRRDDEDSHLLVWEGECAETVVPHQVVRVGYPDESLMLARLLDRPMRDPLFESSLATAAAIVSRLRPTSTDFPEPVE